MAEGKKKVKYLSRLKGLSVSRGAGKKPIQFENGVLETDEVDVQEVVEGLDMFGRDITIALTGKSLAEHNVAVAKERVKDAQEGLKKAEAALDALTAKQPAPKP